MIEVRAPAKINLYLHVTGRRPDGYHLLDSLVGFADVGDDLRLTPGDGYGLTVDGPFAHQLASTPVEDNLVTRAARALARQLGRSLHVDIRLTKNLPIASGIGGGSADAAATLIGLCRLWEIEPTPALLEPLAQELGQDVVVCLASRSARLVGIGDSTVPVPDLPRAWLVLVNPGSLLPTPEVFADFRRQPPVFSTAPPCEAFGDFETLTRWLDEQNNDLQPVAIARVPQIEAVLAALMQSPECRLARMSGSGATCFGIFSSEEIARQVALRLLQSHRGWWVAATTWYVGRPER